MLLAEKKLRKRIEEILDYRYRDIHPLEEFLMKEDNSGISNPTLPQWVETDGTIRTGDRWKGRDKYLWMEKTVKLPDEWRTSEEDAGPAPVGVFDFGLTGGGNNSGFEALLYIDGEPYQAVDSNHKEVFFKPEHSGREITLTFRLWSGLEGGGIPRENEHEIKTAMLALLDPGADDLYYLSDMMLGTVEVLPENRTERQELLDALEQAYLCVDWSEPGSDAFYHSVAEADNVLNDLLGRMEKREKVTVDCVGHTHIDTAWLWRLKHTREKASRSFSSVLRLMEMFPEYIFLQTQPQIYQYIKEDFPQIYEKIRQRAAEGRWEVDGAMWVEADCNLTSGESLTRQILLGRKFMLEEFGKEPEFLWLPDVFGYSWALPQILKKSGIEMFMTIKISWNQFNRMPHDTFWWKGIDGSQVLAHFLTTPDPGQAADSWGATYNGQLLPETVQGSWDRYRDKAANKEMLISYGFGDGGGGVNRDMLERRRRMDRIPGLPNVKTSSAGDYFRRLKETARKAGDSIHTWDGELYLEYHRGTYTSQGYNKKTNRFMENLYRKAEWMTAMEGLLAGDLGCARQEELTEGWKILLTHQFHDIIPGSSIHEVYEDSRQNYRIAEMIAGKTLESFYHAALDKRADCISILNPLGNDRGGLVWIDGLEADAVYTADGKGLPVQKGDGGAWINVDNVPSMGVKYLYLPSDAQAAVAAAEAHAGEEMPDAAAGAHAGEEMPHEAAGTQNNMFRTEELDGGMAVSTPFYELTLNSSGQISGLYDKAAARQVLAEGECANVFQLFEDKPLDYDAWDIDIYYTQKKEEIGNRTMCSVLENGPCRMVVRQEWSFGRSVISQDLILYARDRRIDFRTRVDWHERQKLLKTSFPVEIRTTSATYDVQYGNVKRPNHFNTSWDEARFESVAHRFVDLSEYGYGVSLLNDCKYGHDIHGNTIRLSLLKSAIYPDYDADRGEHLFTYSLLPHSGDFVEGGTVEAAAALNQPLEAVQGRLRLPGRLCLPGRLHLPGSAQQDSEASLVRLEGAHVELDAFKKSEDGRMLVLRFHEYAGARGRVAVKTGFPFSAFAECDLMERPLEDLRSGDEMSIEIRPYEIKTLLIQI